jgi:hypothetical protein
VKTRLVALEVIATVKHCSNDCPHMSLDAKHCNAFGKDLRWDDKRVVNGNRRLHACLRAELDVR